MNPVPLLSLKNVTKSYGSLCVANAISFEVNEGETLGIIGPNGAGKTTLFNLIAGSLPLDQGIVKLEGSDITTSNPTVCCQRGLGRTFQIPKTFGSMSVYENILVGLVSKKPRPSRKEIKRRAADILEMTKLEAYANTKAKELSIIRQKSLGLACALSTSPKLLLLDEVAGGLTNHELQAFLKMLALIKSSGITIIWIEHAVYALASFVERMIVIDFGKQIADGDPMTLLEDPLIKEIYLGGEN